MAASAAASAGAAAAGDKRASPLGTWDSPVTSALITSSFVRLADAVPLADGGVAWLEARPAEGGRTVLVHLPPAAGEARDVTPPAPAAGAGGSAFYVRTRVQEYGGGASLIVPASALAAAAGAAGQVEAAAAAAQPGGDISGGGDTGGFVLFFSNFADQRVYQQRFGGGDNADAAAAQEAPRPLTRDGRRRFADFALDAARRRLIAVCEDHTALEGKAEGEGGEPTTTLAAIDLDSGDVTTLAEGFDFYSAPALSPDGRRLAWCCWNHPSMPWDDVELFVADVAADGALRNARRVAGGPGEAVQQPRWSHGGGSGSGDGDGSSSKLFYVSDAAATAKGWWNLHRLDEDGEEGGGGVRHTPLLPMEAEFGFPPWLLGLKTYEVLAGGAHVLCVVNDPRAAGTALGVVDVAAKRLHLLESGFSSFGRVEVSGPGLASPDGALTVVTTAAGATRPQAVARLRVPNVAALLASAPKDWEELKGSSGDLDMASLQGYLSEPEAITFPTAGGAAVAHAVLYRPVNARHVLPGGVRPPLLVRIHGGPTSAASSALSLGHQFWTSRGFAIADVNYRGSTGYGRAYRDALKGAWGIADVDDVCAVAEHLAAKGEVDASKLTIDGGSAGGYTTLAALAFRDVFSAGASHYGVADCALLAQHTHKFEARYLDGLIAPWPAGAAVYKERSPLFSADKIRAPCALFQGDEDKIVPPEQATAMHSALVANKVPTTLMMYAGEQHGFRKAENIRSALEGELYFYSRALGFPGAYPPELQPMHIDGLDDAAEAPAAAAAGKKDEL